MTLLERTRSILPSTTVTRLRWRPCPQRSKRATWRGRGVGLRAGDRATASLRRPFKKGARLPGGSSRSDEEIHVGGLNGFGEFFLQENAS